MPAALLLLISEVRNLVYQVAPRWRKELEKRLRIEEESTRCFVRLVQEMLLWPLVHFRSSGTSSTVQGLTTAWELHLKRVMPSPSREMRLRTEEWQILKRIWRRMLVSFSHPNVKEFPLLSTYVHFWNPLTGSRVTEPVHFLLSNPLDAESTEAKELRVAFELYAALDHRARRENPPLFTANQLLQRLRGPSPYSIHWASDALGASLNNPCAIHVGIEESQIVSSSIFPLPDLSVLAAKNDVDRSACLAHDAHRLFARFENLVRNQMSGIRETVDRTLVVLRRGASDLVDETHRLDDRQAAFFLFGLALNWHTALRCKHLYNFPVAQGGGCSIVTITTTRELSRLERSLCENFAMAALHPIMLGAFFDSMEKVESDLYSDLRHELEQPIGVLHSALEEVRNAVCGADLGERLINAQAALGRANRLFCSFAPRVITRIKWVRDSSSRPTPTVISIHNKVIEVKQEVLGMIGPEEQWFRDAKKVLETVQPSRAQSGEVREIINNFQAALHEDQRDAQLRNLLDLYLKPAIQAEFRAEICEGPLESILSNLYRNALAHCSWGELLMRDPAEFRMLSLARATGTSDRCTISVSNLVGASKAKEFEDAAGAVPCYYASWWRAVVARGNYGRRGVHHTLAALRRLREPDYPAEETTRWLVVTSYDPFTVELTLPVE